MTDRRVAGIALVAVAVVAVAVAARSVPLLWSPLPATLDGLAYAGYARDAVATGTIPLRVDEPFRADDFVFTSLLAVGTLLLDVPPRLLAQPLTAAVGGLGTLVVVAILARVGEGLDLPATRLRVGLAVSGLGLAVSGIYARRTGVPDSELLGLVWLPLVAVAFVRAVDSDRRRWWIVLGLLLVALPLTHTLGATVVLIVLSTLAAAGLARGRVAAAPLAVAGGYWLYVGGYYALVEGVPGVFVPYADRVAGRPGLFLAWVVLAAVGLPWLYRARRARRYGPAVVSAVGAGLLARNAVVTVFPGTLETPPALLAFALPLFVPFALAGVAADRAPATREGRALLAILVGSVALVGFGLTAGLTPDYFDLTVRSQTFVHVPLLALAGLGAVAWRGEPRVAGRWRPRIGGRPSIRRLLLGLAVGALLISAPLASVNLDTVSGPATTTPQGFHATAFATRHVPGPWATDGPNARIQRYYGRSGGVAVTPVFEWLHGGDPPACPTLVQRRWLTRGANFYPAPSRRLAASVHRRFTTRNHLVYGATGLDALALVVPRGGGGTGC